MLRSRVLWHLMKDIEVPVGVRLRVKLSVVEQTSVTGRLAWTFRLGKVTPLFGGVYRATLLKSRLADVPP